MFFSVGSGPTKERRNFALSLRADWQIPLMDIPSKSLLSLALIDLYLCLHTREDTLDQKPSWSFMCFALSKRKPAPCKPVLSCKKSPGNGCLPTSKVAAGHNPAGPNGIKVGPAVSPSFWISESFVQWWFSTMKRLWPSCCT